MTTPVRYTKGVTNAFSSEVMGYLGMPDPTKYHVFMEDFHRFDPGEWVITRIHTGATAGSETISDADGGILTFYPANGDDDSTFFQWKGTANVSTASEIFTISSGKKFWFKTRLYVSDATQSDFIVGLQSADTTPLTSPVDRIAFLKDDGDTNLDFSAYASSTSTLSDTGLHTVANSTHATFGFYYDGVSTLSYFVNDVQAGCGTGTTLPTAEMSPIFGIQNGAAAAKTMVIDYICAIKER